MRFVRWFVMPTTMTDDEFISFYDTYFRVAERFARHIMRDAIESIGVADFAMWYAYCHPDKFRDVPRAAVESYLVRIALTRSYNELRHRRRNSCVDLSAIENTVYEVSDEDLEHQVEMRDFKDTVARFVVSMPDIYRDALTLRILKEMSVSEIAKALGIPFGTAKTRCRRGMNLLKVFVKSRGYSAF